MSDLVTFEVRDGIGIVIADNPPVNALSVTVRQGVLDTITALRADPAVGAIVLACAGHTFFAGADIREFDQPPRPPHNRAVIEAIERSPKPVVAAIHGTALGGGLEIALGCHARIATAAAQLGLPEVKLGLIPGAGGTQRLPRLIGVSKSLEMIALGEPTGAPAALACGLIGRISNGDLLDDAIALAREMADADELPINLRNRELEPAEPGAYRIFRDRHVADLRHLHAPEAAITCIEAATELSFDAGMDLEAETFQRLRTGAQSPALRHIFFARRAAQRGIDGGAPADLDAVRVRMHARVTVERAAMMQHGKNANAIDAAWERFLSDPEAQDLRDHGDGDGIVASILQAMAAEGRRLIDEGIACRASDIDIACVDGGGWPAWRGGPMFQVRASAAAS